MVHERLQSCADTAHRLAAAANSLSPVTCRPIQLDFEGSAKFILGWEKELELEYLSQSFGLTPENFLRPALLAFAGFEQASSMIALSRK